MALWHSGKLIRSEIVAKNVKSLIFEVQNHGFHTPGQHYDIRLTAENGYQAQRSYSVASPPERQGILEFGIQLLEDGEVSPYLFQMQSGEQIELRGPIGGHFIWDTSYPGPLILIGGGSGMVPLMCMLRHHMLHLKEDSGRQIVFLVSARTHEHILYREELEKYAGQDPNLRLAITLTDSTHANWEGYARRIDETMFKEVFPSASSEAHVYVCGPTPFVEKAAQLSLAAGFAASQVRTERFGGA